MIGEANMRGPEADELEDLPEVAIDESDEPVIAPPRATAKAAPRSPRLGKPSPRQPRPAARLEDLVGRDVELRLVGPSGPLRGELLAVGKTDLIIERHGSRLAMVARSGVLAVLDEGGHTRREP